MSQSVFVRELPLAAVLTLAPLIQRNTPITLQNTKKITLQLKNYRAPKEPLWQKTFTTTLVKKKKRNFNF